VNVKIITQQKITFKTMRTLFRITVLLIVLYFIFGCTRNIETLGNVNSTSEVKHNCSNHCTHTRTPNKLKYKPTVVVRALGDVDYSDLTYAVNVIEDFYGFNCVIGSNQPITDDLYISGTTSIIEPDKCVRKFYSTQRVVYIVDKKLWHNGRYYRGFATTNGGTVVVSADFSFMKETIIHEIGHTFGLSHCSDRTCIMATSDNDVYENGSFCSRCRPYVQFY